MKSSPTMLPPSPKKPINFLKEITKAFFSSFSFSSWIILSTILLLQIFLFSSTIWSTLHRHLSSTPPPPPSNLIDDHHQPCSSGHVYVYDLPAMFNKDLLDKCDSLDPYHSWCDMVKNGGFGRGAMELTGLVPDNLVPAWYWTEQTMLEPIFHNRILRHTCRTYEPESATAFYIPFYAALAVGRYLKTNYTADDRDKDCALLLKWVQYQPYWNRSYGSDHFTTLGRITWAFRRWGEDDWGSRYLLMPGMQNITRLIIERYPWDPLDIGVPYPTGFHPRSDADVIRWQNFVRAHKRETLFCFAGGTRRKIRNDFRGVLLSQCVREWGSCRVVNCTGTRCVNGESSIMETFLNSDFCLQPRGDSHTRKSVFDCMLAGSIPVLFWKRTAYGQYEWFLPGEPASYSVFIDHKEVRNGRSIRHVLANYTREELRRMREKVIETIPKLIYAKEGLRSTRDAFDISVERVLKRFKEQAITA